jgi:hypothetical protein
VVEKETRVTHRRSPCEKEIRSFEWLFDPQQPFAEHSMQQPLADFKLSNGPSGKADTAKRDAIQIVLRLNQGTETVVRCHWMLYSPG